MAVPEPTPGAAKRLKGIVELGRRDALSGGPFAPLPASMADWVWPDWLWPTVLRCYEDDKLKAAFRLFGLDPKDPYSWLQMVRYFAFVLFDPPRRRGAPTQWDDKARCLLLHIVATKKRNLRARISDRRACELVAKDRTSPKLFRGGLRQGTNANNVEGLRKQLRAARDPERNAILRQYRDEAGRFWRKILREHKDAGKKLFGTRSPSDAEIDKRALAHALGYLAAWGK